MILYNWIFMRQVLVGLSLFVWISLAAWHVFLVDVSIFCFFSVLLLSSFCTVQWALFFCTFLCLSLFLPDLLTGIFLVYNYIHISTEYHSRLRHLGVYSTDTTCYFPWAFKFIISTHCHATLYIYIHIIYNAFASHGHRSLKRELISSMPRTIIN